MYVSRTTWGSALTHHISLRLGLLSLLCTPTFADPPASRHFPVSTFRRMMEMLELQTSTSMSSLFSQFWDQTQVTRHAQRVLLCTEPSQCVWHTGTQGAQRHLGSPEARVTGACELPNVSTLDQIQVLSNCNICSY